MQKLLDILRVVHNYVLPNKGFGDKGENDAKWKKIAKTPATRLGLTKAKVNYEDILHFT